MNTADMILFNGRFITMESECELAEAVAIKDGKILYVGNTEEAMKFSCADTKVFDLHGDTHNRSRSKLWRQ